MFESAKPLLRLALPALMALPVFYASQAVAQAYPDKPIKLVVPFAAGGTTDALGRIFAQAFSQSIGQSVVVENRPGAGSAFGIDIVAKSPADGYTLLWGSADGLAVLPAIRTNLPYNAEKDLTPITLFAAAPFVYALHPSIPAKSVADFVRYAKANPGKINYGSPGVGSVAHLATALLETRIGIKLTHVPYKGGSQAISDLISGQIEMTTTSPTVILPFVQAGSISAIAQTGQMRSPLLPNVPTMVEAGYGDFVVGSWFGLLGPANLPDGVTKALKETSERIKANPELQTQFKQVGADLMDARSIDFKAFIKDNIKMWKDVVSKAGIQVQTE
ncbi:MULTISPECIES: tripartite tricarboxylate transporter substrate binding protein [unclassified Beijerinckia]|uniref:Bug family tripartite tricarboxylate transporter substrate binding protein n=1 Tax=unclassified Beijerinckia TaxID=2638183 RepID=UPI000897D1E2|nr:MULTISPECIES: tripartite tricarboxylate transporter substrate binding protein [unclassified Beijerinckia]MDH7798939.1 tripartite-type tricarboxylate transporter receptor subunit TctC [Beijerinckia sp. GAS462]SED86429.1 Tripartite-type tricarboxylate transporter, receptor component TctC [Beijerinckia sp. 28-YEA-48]